MSTEDDIVRHRTVLRTAASGLPVPFAQGGLRRETVEKGASI